MVLDTSSQNAFPHNLNISLDNEIQQAINKSHQFFLENQNSVGYWWALLEADSTLVADYIMLTHYVNKVDPHLEKKALKWILDTQLEDGGWNIYHNAPSEINATVKCLFAMQLAGMTDADPQCQKAREVILRLGGLAKVNSYTRFYLALFNQYPWSQIVSIPPELMFLPTSFYFNIYEISSWSRAILVPMSIIWSLKPIKQAPAHIDCSTWWTSDESRPVTSLRRALSWRNFFFALDRILKHSNRFYAPFTRREALRRAENWMNEHMSRGGGLAAIYPAMLNAIIALDALGYDQHHPMYQNAWDEFMRLMVEREDDLWFQPCFSPVWDTALTTAALERSGMAPDHPAIQRAVEWLINQEIPIRGDWQIKNPYGPASGWAFEFENDFYPDTDDSAMVLMAIEGARIPNEERRQAVMKRAVEWLLSMQSSDGGWGAFDVDNNKEVLNLIPFADHNALLDPSTADVTARILEMFGQFGYDLSFSPVSRAVKYLKELQEEDGAWYGRWGVNYIYGTWQVVTGLTRVGVPVTDPCIVRGVEWLIRHQNDDGGWGESCLTYEDPSLRGQGPSTPSQTAWALMGIMNGGVVDHDSVRNGIDYLVRTQLPTGNWDEQEFTGTGFPRVFYLRYTYYRNYFPLMALGLYQKLTSAEA